VLLLGSHKLVLHMRLLLVRVTLGPCQLQLQLNDLGLQLNDLALQLDALVLFLLTLQVLPLYML
jgi:hypothetical protein